MAYIVEATAEFERWWLDLDEAAQEHVAAYVQLLEERGPQLPHPYSSGIKGSKLDHLRELRIPHKGAPLRIFYAFDPRRHAILLTGGDKTGEKRFYVRMIGEAEALYAQHLATMNDGEKNHARKQAVRGSEGPDESGGSGARRRTGR